MANKKIIQLDDATAQPLDPLDLIPMAKYVSPGVYQTSTVEFDNFMGYVQGLGLSQMTGLGQDLNGYDKINYGTDAQFSTSGTISGGNAAADYKFPFCTIRAPLIQNGQLQPFMADVDMYIYGVNCPYVKVINHKNLQFYSKDISPGGVEYYFPPSGTANNLPAATSTYTVTTSNPDYTFHGTLNHNFTYLGDPYQPRFGLLVISIPGSPNRITCEYPIENTLWFSHTSLPDTSVELKCVLVFKLYNTLLF